jgi:large subunit ribosomal protein L9
MKVILLRDVAKIGRRGQVIEISDGYAQNQLIPKKWAEPATPTNLKKITNLAVTAKAQDDAKQAEFEAAAKILSSTRLVIKGDANMQGHLFKAVHEEDIITAAAALGAKLERRWVGVPSPIKSLGQHTILLKREKQEVACMIEVISKA